MTEYNIFFFQIILGKTRGSSEWQQPFFKPSCLQCNSKTLMIIMCFKLTRGKILKREIKNGI
ncbi:hypothetical protein BpHYR1_021733 [Brachionus plicatilis]|uniref:Uncharacterized protein n=1 Tax=Brachionus plicatilis TaxID=10195 RepID=A0A3M7PYT4_BRAPC|nr:hypothetical protein BpHYR1_021733 [Brachionus plicatilis]